MERCKFHGIHTAFTYRESWGGRRTEVKNSMMHGRVIEFDNITHSKFSIVDTIHLCAIADKMKATLESFSLKYVCSPDGYGLREERTEIPGDQIYKVYHTDKKRYFDYLHDDVTDTELLVHFLLPPLYYLLTYVPSMNLQNLIFAGNGQLWNKIIMKHYGRKPDTDTKILYPGGFTGIQSGVYKSCCKIDVASLYPSIMLAMGIHSKKDPDMYQLAVLSLIREERLRLKDLGAKGDKEADYQNLALKILINSGYGVLGTIGIPFNDMDAASMVTAYGRKVLDLMIQKCREKGAKIVQADTDGIIIEHPELERVHKEVQEQFPSWVVLDYEDEYDLVWIYKRKNYITYKNGKSKAIGIVRKRDKSELFKRYLTYVPQLFAEHGMDAVKEFTDNICNDIKDRKIPVELLAETKKMVDYKDKSTTSKIAKDLNASPGDKVTFYRYEKTEKYTTPKQKIEKVRVVIGYKRIEDYNNDYAIDHYIKEITKFKKSTSGKVTQEGWFPMFEQSIINPINETSSGEKL